MEYKGYVSGPIGVKPASSMFTGTVAGIRDVIYFEGSTAEELEASFRRSIDRYLALRAGAGHPAVRSE